MSNKVDERITRIRFDNDQFERGVATSMQSLDRLTNKLGGMESAEAFRGIQSSADNINFSVLEKAISSVGDKFSSLKLIAINVLSDIASSAVNTGLAMVKNLSTDNIAAGWEKYDQEVQAVQTIMVTLDDTTIEEVEDHLKKVGWYADETSYSYNEMVSAMSKLISSGVNLDDATNAVIGISNAAAAAGVNTTKAQQAFYNFSQAFGAGYMQLLDWRSIELLNMGTPQFKKNIIRTAVEMGKIVDLGNEMYVASSKYGQKGWEKSVFNVNNMRESLSDKWFDKDVMNKVLGSYTNFTNKVYELQTAEKSEYDTASEVISSLREQGENLDEYSAKAFIAGQEAKTFSEAIGSVKDAVSTKWKDTFKMLFGNYDEAKGLWTTLAEELYDLFALSGDVRNEILSQWSSPLSFMVPDEKVRAAYQFPELQTGRDILIDGLWNIYHSIVNVVNLVKTAWREVFPQITAKRLYELTKKFRDITERLRDSTENLSGLKNFLVGVFSAFKKVLRFGKSLFNLAKKIWPIAERLLTLISKLAGALIDFAKSIADFINENVDFEPILDLISTGIEKICEWLDNINSKDIKIPAFQTIIDISSSLLDSLEPVRKILEDIFTYLLGSISKKGMTSGVWNLTDSIASFGQETSTAGYYIGVALGNLLEVLIDFLKFASVLFGNIMEIVGHVISWVQEQIEGMSVGQLLKTFILAGIGKFIIGLGHMVISIINIAASFGRILGSISGLIRSFARKNTGELIESIAKSILMIAGSVFMLSKIDNSQMGNALNALMTIVSCIGAMYLIMRIVDGYYEKASKNTKRIQLRNFGFVGLGIAVLSMTLAIRSIVNLLKKDNITPTTIAIVTGLVIGIAAALATISVAITRLSGGNRLGLASLYPISLSLSILMMVKAFKMINEMDIKDVGKILMTIIGVLGTLYLASFAIKRFSAGSGVGVIIFAATFSFMLRNFEKIEKMSFERNSRTTPIIIAITAIIGIFTLYSYLLKNITGKEFGSTARIIGATSGILLLATSFILVANSFKVLNKVGLGTILSGGAIITSILGVMIGLTHVAGKTKINAFGTISALSILSVGLSILLGSISLLAKAPLANGLIAALDLSIIISALTGLTYIAGKTNIKSFSSILSIAAVTASLTVLIIALKELSKEDPKKVFSSIAALGIAVIELSGMYYLISKMSNPVLKSIPTILTITLTAGLLGGALVVFSALIDDAEKSIKAASAIGIFAIMLSSSIYVMDKIGAGSSLKNLIPLIASIGLLGTVIGTVISLFAKFGNTNDIIFIASSIGITALTISAAIRVLGSIPKLSLAETGNQLLLFGGITVILGTVITTMSLLLNNNNLSWISKYGWQILAVVGIITALTVIFGTLGNIINAGAAVKAIEALAIVSGGMLLIGVLLYDIVSIINLVYDATGQSFVNQIQEAGNILWEIGSLVGKLVGGVVFGGLSDIAEELSSFSNAIVPFISFISSIPDDFSEKLINFSEGFAVFTAKGFWYTFKDMFQKGDLFANTLNVFKNAAEPMTETVSALSKIGDTTNAISALSFIDSLGPAITSLNNTKVNNLEKKVIPALEKLPANINNFGSAFSGIDDTIISKSNIVTEMLNKIGVMAGSFYDKNGSVYNLGDIGLGMETFGSGIQNYDNSISSVSENSVEKTEMIKQMVVKLLEVNDSIGKNRGFSAWFNGWTDIGKFGENLGEFVTNGLSKYYDSIRSYSITDMEGMVDKTIYISQAISSIAELSDVIGKNKGFVPAVKGTTDFEKFSDKLPALADSIILYGRKLLDPSSVSSITAASNVTNNLGNSFRNLVDQNIISGIDGISNSIRGLSSSGIENLALLFDNKYVVELEHLAYSIIDKFLSVFTNDTTRAKVDFCVANLLAFVRNAFLRSSENKDLIDSLVNPLFETIGKSFDTCFEKIGADYKTLTNNIVSGIAEGIPRETPYVEKAILKLHKDVDKVNNVFWETHSPSKRTFRLGTYIGQGLGNGILASKDHVVSSFEEISDAINEGGAVSSIEELYNGISSVISGASGEIENSNGTILDNIKSLFSNLKNGDILSGGKGLEWITEKFKEFIGQSESLSETFDGTNWKSLVIATGGNPFNTNGESEYFDQLQKEFENWMSKSYDLNITPVFTDENGKELDPTDFQSLLGDSSYGSTSLSRRVADYTAEDIRNLSNEIYNLEDALYALKEAMKDQRVTHTGELTVRYTNESDFIDRIQTSIISSIRREART